MYLSPFPLTYLLFLSNYFVNSSLISFVLIDRYWKKIPAPNSHVIIWPSGHVAVGSIHACAPTSINLAVFHRPTTHAQITLRWFTLNTPYRPSTASLSPDTPILTQSPTPSPDRGSQPCSGRSKFSDRHAMTSLYRVVVRPWFNSLIGTRVNDRSEFRIPSGQFNSIY
jgi:hypothetical protein